MTIRASVSAQAAASEISLNTGIIQTITIAQFNNTLNQINSSLYYPNEAFTWLCVINASQDVTSISLRLILPNGNIVTQDIQARVGVLHPVRAVALSSSDPELVVNVGVGQ